MRSAVKGLAFMAKRRTKTPEKATAAQYRQAYGGLARGELALRAKGKVVLSLLEKCRYGSDRLQGFIGVMGGGSAAAR